MLAALCGVVNKDELLELMNSMGMTKQFDTKEAEVKYWGDTLKNIC